jgi:hypothetical protein
MADETARERHRAGEERDQAAEVRERQVATAQRQNAGLALLRHHRVPQAPIRGSPIPPADLSRRPPVAAADGHPP